MKISIVGFIFIFIATILGFYLVIIFSRPFTNFAFGIALAAIGIILSIIAIIFAILGIAVNFLALIRGFTKIDSIMVLLSAILPTVLSVFSGIMYLNLKSPLVPFLILTGSLIFAVINWIIFIIGVLRK
ncbi:MAG: hypothetical protein ACO2OV_06715 [Thermoproteota archaeon]